jgi:superfamily I DNA/RNA helicase
MRTSEELTMQHKCSNYRTDIPLSNYNPQKIFRECQTEVLLRLLHGEQIEDIPAELSYQLESKGYRFEDAIQKNNRLYFAAKDIMRFASSDHREKHFISEEDAIIDFHNEKIKVIPSYYYINDGHLVMVKIKPDTPKQTFTNETGRQIAVDERENDESYALMLLARKIRDEHYPNLDCRVEIDHLNDEYVKPKRGELPVQYIEDFFDSDHSGNITTIEDGIYYDKFFEKKWEIEDKFPTTCGGASCSGCGCYTACHYSEPPLADDMSTLMKNPDDVRLNFNQHQIANHMQGSMLVDSGAGAGKTTCITMNILNALRNGTPPEKICLLTFTNAAAKEMTDRVAMYTRAILNDPEKAGQLPPELDINDIMGCTFNGLCQKVIEEHYEELGFDRPPKVIPDDVEQEMVHNIFDLYPDKIPGWNYNKSSKSIYDKSTGFSFGESAAQSFLKLAQAVKEVPEGEYKWGPLEKLVDGDKKPLPYKYIVQLKMMVEDFEAAHLTKINGLNSSGKAYITYADQFLLVKKLTQMHPTLWDEYGFSHIIVDEVQDSNTTQLNLLMDIQNNSSYESLLAVGDMQQSIYGFNGAVPENMYHENYQEFFGPTEFVSIRENFRCSREVIGFTNTMIDSIVSDTEQKGISIGDNEYEHLVGTREGTMGVQVEGYYSQKSQMKDIAKRIKADIESGIMPGDIMFITRNKAQLNMLASELTKLEIPSVLRCPVPYIDNSNVGTAVAFMDSFLYGYEEGIFDYCNQLEKGELFYQSEEEITARINAFSEELKGQPRSYDVLKERLDALDPDKRDECYQSFLDSFSSCKDLVEIEDKLYAFKQHGSKSTFKREATYSEVQLSTIHSAKGLESKVIYCDIHKLDDKRFHEPRLRGSVAKEYKETNRLEYVAYTRAKDKLVVTAPYVVADNLRNPVLNKRLINAYHAVNKTYGYNFMSYMAEKAKNKAEEQEYGDETVDYIMPTLDDMYRQYQDEVRNQASLEESVEAMGIDFEDFDAHLQTV